MTDNQLLIKICGKFGIEGELVESKVFTDGHINSTYYTEFKHDGKTKKYLVQKVNTHVFRNQDDLMNNIISVTKFLKKKLKAAGADYKRETLRFLKAENGKYFYMEGEDSWRIYHYIDNVYTCNIIDNKELFEDSGRSFGRFQMLLSDYPGETLKETIPDFHNTPKRISVLEEAFSEDVVERAKEVTKEIEFLLDRKEKAGIGLGLLEKGEIPIRVTHNDTKINNILFDEKTNKGICVIDLDTIMPGLSLYDFGDSIRSGANTAAEDETDISKISVSLPLFESYTKGFLESCAKALTMAEVEHLAYGAWLMTFESAVRFLTDYLKGDVYFKIKYPQHNLDRAVSQIALLKDIEKNLDKMNEIVLRIYEEKVSK